jgi:hypothetical protein
MAQPVVAQSSDSACGVGLCMRMNAWASGHAYMYDLTSMQRCCTTAALSITCTIKCKHVLELVSAHQLCLYMHLLLPDVDSVRCILQARRHCLRCSTCAAVGAYMYVYFRPEAGC